MIDFPPGCNARVGSIVAGRFRVQETIRAGRVFSVHTAFDLLRREPVRLWTFAPALRQEHPWQAVRFRELAEQRYRVRHQLFLNVVLVGEEDDSLFFVEETPGGECLQAAIHRRREAHEPFSITEAVVMARLLCQALSHLHGSSAVHGFLNPEEVVLEAWVRGPVAFYPRVSGMGLRDRLRDLGMGCDVLSEEAASYAPPEFAGPLALRKESDVHGIGAILYTLLTLRPPTGCFVRPSRLRPDAPAELDEILLKAMEEDPEDRFRSTEDLLGALEGVEFQGFDADNIRKAEEQLLAPWPEGIRSPEQGKGALEDQAGQLARAIQLLAEPAPAAPRPRSRLRSFLRSVPMLSRFVLILLALALLLLASRDVGWPPWKKRSAAENTRKWDQLFRTERGTRPAADDSRSETP
ncbi:MAG: protein kinase [bacterium]